MKILDSTGTAQFVNSGNGFGIYWNNTGSGQVFDGTTAVGAISGYPAFVNTHVELDVQVSDFTGSASGATTVSFLVNGATNAVFTLTHSYSGNYLSLFYALPDSGTTNFCTYENLKVQAIVPPGANLPVAGVAFSTQPGAAVAGSPLGQQPVLQTVDSNGVPTAFGLPATLMVSVALTNAPGALSGMTSYNIGTSGGDGVVSFTNLQINSGGIGDILVASATNLMSGGSGTAYTAASAPFNVQAPQNITSAGVSGGLVTPSPLPLPPASIIASSPPPISFRRPYGRPWPAARQMPRARL